MIFKKYAPMSSVAYILLSYLTHWVAELLFPLICFLCELEYRAVLIYPY